MKNWNDKKKNPRQFQDYYTIWSSIWYNTMNKTVAHLTSSPTCNVYLFMKQLVTNSPFDMW